MASPYYVDSTATGGANTGGSWANAFLTFAQAVTAATTANDEIYVSHAHSESLGADTTYTFGANVKVFCRNSGTNALADTAVIGAQAANYAITLAGAYVVYVYGVIFQNGTNTTSSRSISLSGSDGCQYEFEDCKFCISGNINSLLLLATTGSAANVWNTYRRCTVKVSRVEHKINLGTRQSLIGCTLDPSGEIPTILFNPAESGCSLDANGCDFSKCTGTLVGDAGVNGQNEITFTNCKFGAGATIKAASTAPLNKGNTTVTAFNCDAGDVHYAMYHGDAFGETVVSAAIYANDGAKYDGTNKCSWKITTTANCSYYWPYKSPWLELYHAGTSSITPTVEILRDGSATAYQDDEVWGEWSYQGTSGYSLATIVDDRMTPLGTPANQTTGDLDASGWTGENATAWFGKLAPAAFTPAEIGYLRFRACVGEPSITVYVDPTLRGLGVTQERSRVTGSGWIETTAAAAGGIWMPRARQVGV